jgi:hypothetical protein
MKETESEYVKSYMLICYSSMIAISFTIFSDMFNKVEINTDHYICYQSAVIQNQPK